MIMLGLIYYRVYYGQGMQGWLVSYHMLFFQEIGTESLLVLHSNMLNNITFCEGYTWWNVYVRMYIQVVLFWEQNHVDCLRNIIENTAFIGVFHLTVPLTGYAWRATHISKSDALQQQSHQHITPYLRKMLEIISSFPNTSASDTYNDCVVFKYARGSHVEHQSNGQLPEKSLFTKSRGLGLSRPITAVKRTAIPWSLLCTFLSAEWAGNMRSSARCGQRLRNGALVSRKWLILSCSHAFFRVLVTGRVNQFVFNCPSRRAKASVIAYSSVRHAGCWLVGHWTMDMPQLV